MTWGSVVSIVRLWVEQLRICASISGWNRILFSSPKCPDQFRGPPAFWLVGAGYFLQMEGDQSVQLTVHLHQVPRFRMNGAAASLCLMHLWFAQG